MDRVVRVVEAVPGIAAGPSPSARPGKGGAGDGPRPRALHRGEAL